MGLLPPRLHLPSLLRHPLSLLLQRRRHPPAVKIRVFGAGGVCVA